MIDQALEYLNRLLDTGVEFPEAEYRTLNTYPNVSYQKLVDTYDTDLALGHLNGLMSKGMQYQAALDLTLYTNPVSREQLLDAYDAQELAK